LGEEKWTHIGHIHLWDMVYCSQTIGVYCSFVLYTTI